MPQICAARFRHCPLLFPNDPKIMKVKIHDLLTALSSGLVQMLVLHFAMIPVLSWILGCFDVGPFRWDVHIGVAVHYLRLFASIGIFVVCVAYASGSVLAVLLAYVGVTVSVLFFYWPVSSGVIASVVLFILLLLSPLVVARVCLRTERAGRSSCSVG